MIRRESGPDELPGALARRAAHRVGVPVVDRVGVVVGLAASHQIHAALPAGSCRGVVNALDIQSFTNGRHDRRPPAAVVAPHRHPSLSVAQPPQPQREKPCPPARVQNVAVLGPQPRRHPGHRLAPRHRRIGRRCHVSLRLVQDRPGRRPGMCVVGSRCRHDPCERAVGVGGPAEFVQRACRPFRCGLGEAARYVLGMFERGTDGCVDGVTGEQAVAAGQRRHRLRRQRISQRLPHPGPLCAHPSWTLELLLPHPLPAKIRTQ